MKFFLIFFLMIFFEMFSSSNHYIYFIDFIYIFVFLINSNCPGFSAMIFSFFAGIYLDFYYSFPVGLHSLIYVTMSYVMYFIKEKVEFNFILSRFVNFIIFSFAVKLIEFTAGYLYGFKIYSDFIELLYPFLNFIIYEFVRTIFINFFVRHKRI